MGTSKAFTGPAGSNPLIPSWLTPPPELVPADVVLPANAPALPPGVDPIFPDQPVPAEIEVPVDDPMRLRGPRIRLNRIAKSRHVDAAKLRTVASEYVRKGLGGSKRAGTRMTGQAKTAGRVLGFIRAVEEKGFVAAAKDLGLGDLSGKTPKEIAPILAEAFLEEGGSIDTGISNRAWVDTIIEAIEAGIIDSDNVSPDVLITLLEGYVTRTIELRILQDIGAKLLPISPDVSRADGVKSELRELVRGEVKRAVRPILRATKRVDRKRLASVGMKIYQQAFEFLRQTPAEE